MPHLFFTASDDDLRARSQQPEQPFGPKQNMWGRTWHKVGSWLKREEDQVEAVGEEESPGFDEKKSEPEQQWPPAAARRPDRTVVPGLPRPITFRRQNSERREHLYPHEPDAEERRASSVGRRAVQAYMTRFSPPPVPRLSFSLPDMTSPLRSAFNQSTESSEQGGVPLNHVSSEEIAGELIGDGEDVLEEFGLVPPIEGLDLHSDADFERRIQEELDAKWILNLSMHFRDHSDREKFFITYAESRNKWRRLTISIDYRNAEVDSLESEMRNELHYQRDKCARIYESIRDSLPTIKFYPTVTNLKLETKEGRLHVHVTEDVNEIIPYPEISKVSHVVDAPRYNESDIEFESHMSGFVYKVRCPGGRCFIKKEIPGPEAVEEFLYEVDALYNLRDSANVIHFEGLVTSDDETLVKGLLISYASEGALIDVLYDFRHSDYLPWSRREQWAKQIVSGLSDIHEAGFIQGDFTLSNIVIDENDNAKIIDINRRGCPVGWEPPELFPVIRSGQRIAMRIGSKTDLFQLGMVLWALGEEQDEPERQKRPLRFSEPERIRDWYREIVDSCLSEQPRNRLSAKELLKKFPAEPSPEEKTHVPPSMSLAPNRSEKEFIDPDTAVSREDIAHQKAEQERERQMRSRMSRRSNLDSEATFADLTNSDYIFESSGSYVVGRRGLSPHSEPAARQSRTATEERRSSQRTETQQRADELEDSPLLSPPMMSVATHEQALHTATTGAEGFGHINTSPPADGNPKEESSTSEQKLDSTQSVVPKDGKQNEEQSTRDEGLHTLQPIAPADRNENKQLVTRFNEESGQQPQASANKPEDEALPTRTTAPTTDPGVVQQEYG